MKKIVALLYLGLFLGCGGGDGGDADSRTCVFSPEINCFDSVAEEAEEQNLSCEVLNGEFVFCGTAVDVEAVIAMTKPSDDTESLSDLSEILAKGTKTVIRD